MGEILFDTNGLIELSQTNKGEIKGKTTIFSIIEFPKALEIFKNLKILYPNSKDFDTSIFLSTNLYKLGKPIPAIDLLIASICYNNGLQLYTKDKHFEYVRYIWTDFEIIRTL